MKRNDKGITLIALVITIVIMLILASVSINMAVHGGLFSYAGRAASETNEAMNQEKAMLDLEDNLTPQQLMFRYETIGYSVSLWGDANDDGKKNNMTIAAEPQKIVEKAGWRRELELDKDRIIMHSHYPDHPASQCHVRTG